MYFPQVLNFYKLLPKKFNMEPQKQHPGSRVQDPKHHQTQISPFLEGNYMVGPYDSKNTEGRQSPDFIMIRMHP